MARICSIEGCGRPHKGHGYCTRHWQNWKKSGNPNGKRGYLKPRDKQVVMTQEVKALYYRWIDLRRGRSGGIAPEWKDNFDAFLSAVGTRPSPLHRLCTFQRGQMLGPTTFQWRQGVRVAREKDEDALAYRRRYEQERRKVLGTTQLDGQLRKKFGDTFGVVALRDMLARQRGLCAICGKPETAKSRTGTVKLLALDHDHRTGRPRELCCQNCNHMLGCVNDDREILLRAAAYLDKHEATPYT